jgi:cytosine/adenosine deaminase-related metal-dependent hydrolase
MPLTYRCRWLLPIDQPPIRDGWLEVDRGRIVALGRGAGPGGSDARDLGDVAVLPGVVNAHTHLELSWMAGLVPPAESMNDWIGAMLSLRRRAAPPADQRLARARDAAAAMAAAGTVLVGDVSNDLSVVDALAGAGLGGLVFHELMGFAALDPVARTSEAWARVRALGASLAAPGRPRIRVTVVAHAPYSVSPTLFREIARCADAVPLSIHLAESPEELEFLRSGRGPIRDTLEALDAWNASWQPPGCSPVEYVAGLGYLRPGTLVVHGVHLTDDDLELLRETGAVLVTCPRSNEWVGAGLPRLAHFYAADLPVAVGTDSLASTTSLSVFDELAEMRRIAPDVAPSALLESATRVGADALGFGGDYGTLASGKVSHLTVVDVPADTRDVEEYLVSGIPASAVRPLSA